MKYKQKHTTYVKGWMCDYCGNIHPEEHQAEECWDKHVTFVMDYIQMYDNEGYPIEVYIKKVEGSNYVEVATYEKKRLEQVSIPIKQGGK